MRSTQGPAEIASGPQEESAATRVECPGRCFLNYAASDPHGWMQIRLVQAHPVGQLPGEQFARYPPLIQRHPGAKIASEQAHSAVSHCAKQRPSTQTQPSGHGQVPPQPSSPPQVEASQAGTHSQVCSSVQVPPGQSASVQHSQSVHCPSQTRLPVGQQSSSP
jgi:hypothetical protein